MQANDDSASVRYALFNTSIAFAGSSLSRLSGSARSWNTKKILFFVISISLSLPAIADSSIPVVQFTIGFGEKVDMQKIHVLGLRAGSDYALNAVEEENKMSDKKIIVLSIVAIAAIGYTVASINDDKPSGLVY